MLLIVLLQVKCPSHCAASNAKITDPEAVLEDEYFGQCDLEIGHAGPHHCVLPHKSIKKKKSFFARAARMFSVSDVSGVSMEWTFEAGPSYVHYHSTEPQTSLLAALTPQTHIRMQACWRCLFPKDVVI